MKLQHMWAFSNGSAMNLMGNNDNWITHSDACLSSDNSLCADYYGKAIKCHISLIKGNVSKREAFCRIIQSSCFLNLSLSHPVSLSMYIYVEKCIVLS